MSTIDRVLASVITNPEACSVKRVAWAFGCAKKDSEEESQLYRALVSKVETILEGRRAAVAIRTADDRASDHCASCGRRRDAHDYVHPFQEPA